MRLCQRSIMIVSLIACSIGMVACSDIRAIQRDKMARAAEKRCGLTYGEVVVSGGNGIPFRYIFSYDSRNQLKDKSISVKSRCLSEVARQNNAGYTDHDPFIHVIQ